MIFEETDFEPSDMILKLNNSQCKRCEEYIVHVGLSYIVSLDVRVLRTTSLSNVVLKSSRSLCYVVFDNACMQQSVEIKNNAHIASYDPRYS